MSDPISARDVARRANRIVPLMGRLMESQMRSPVLPLPPAHFHVLTHVDREPHTLSGLAERIAVSSASLSRTITVMEERGWVTRKRSPQDRRTVLIQSTDAGHEVLRNIERRSEDFIVQTLSKLSQEQLDQVAAGLDILIGTFGDHLTHVPSDQEVEPISDPTTEHHQE